MKEKKKMKKRIMCLALIVCMTALYCVPVMASNKLMQNIIYTGTVKLLNDFKLALLGVEAVAVVVLEILEFIKMQAAEDDEKPRHKKKCKSILVTGIIIIVLTGLIPTILSYYQETPKEETEKEVAMIGTMYELAHR